MYQLYYYPANANAAPPMLLQEFGVDYELVLVDRTANAQKSKEYLKLNPSGRIPALIDQDMVLFEAAIDIDGFGPSIAPGTATISHDGFT